MISISMKNTTTISTTTTKKPKAINCRMDIASRNVFPRAVLIRLVVRDNRLVLDKDQDLPGRGIYVYPSMEALEKIKKKGLLKRYQRDGLDSLYQELADDVKRREA